MTIYTAEARCLSAKREEIPVDIFFLQFKGSNDIVLIKIKILKAEQAGTELCQAQPSFS